MKKSETPVSTPIAEGLIDRVVRGVRYVVRGADPDEGWFTPLQPLQPFAQDKNVQGRQFDYQVGYNLQLIPKAQEGITYAQLRTLADSLDVLRIVIETRKDTISSLKWGVVPTDTDKEKDDRCREVEEFFKFPDQEHTWAEWIRAVLEDLFVIDAPTIYPRYDKGGKLYALEPVDGATIKRVIDGTGRTPKAPDVAFQQILKGVPAVDYSRDELIYKPRNIRTNRIYGYSPVEQILMTVNTALRRQVSQLQFYTEGSTPDMILTVPAEWNPDQVKQFYDWWQSMLAGNTGNRRKTMFVPNGVNSVNTKEGMLKDQYDEWLAKVVCYTFSVSPQHFLSSMNRATAQVAADNSKEEGLEPIKAWLKNLIDYIIWKYFGYKDLELEYVDNKDPDLLQQAQIDDIYLKNGVYGVNEVRAKLGLDALSDEELAAAAPQPEPDPNNPDDGDDNDPAPDDTMKMDIAGKKSFRVLTPINRQRTSVTKQEKKLTDLLTKLFDDEKDRIAKQVVDGYSNIGKADDDHAPVDSVLAEITAAAAADKILSDVTIDWSESAESISAIIKSISTDGVVEAAVQLGWDEQSALDLANTNAEKWAAERGAELVGMKWVDGELVTNPNPYWAITDSTRNRLKSTIVDAIKLGSTNNELAANIVDNYAFSTDRAIMIARTETAFADVEGNMLMYKEVKDTGVVILKKWITGAGECDRCNLNGQHDPIDLNGIFPSGAKQPPDHPNCRCDILPVLEEED